MFHCVFNNMKIHPYKTKELIVTRARSRTARVPSMPLIDGAERLTSLRVLGVLLGTKLTMSEHVSQVLSACSSSIFALRLLRNHGLRSNELHLVARAIAIASILFGTTAWWGFAGVGDRQRLELLVARLRRMGYLPKDFPSGETLDEEADRDLFKTISQCPSHVLRHLLTDKPTSSRSLRVRAHSFVFPP